MSVHAGSCVGWEEGGSGLQASGLHQHRARAPALMSPSHLYPAPGPHMPHLSYLMSPGAGARPRLTPPRNPVTPVTLGWPNCGQCQPVLRGRGHLQATASPHFPPPSLGLFRLLSQPPLLPPPSHMGLACISHPLAPARPPQDGCAVTPAGGGRLAQCTARNQPAALRACRAQ